MESINTATVKKIGIQGYVGAFHHIAANAFYEGEEIEVVSYDHFIPLANSVSKDASLDAGLMAIENSLAGSLLPNYQLLLRYDLRIQGEIYLKIRQNLLGLSGQQIADLREVHSHPVAIEQCRPFFANHPHIQLIAAGDTALSAKRVQQSQEPGVGAIASELASEIYDLEVLEYGIESHSENFTRFLVLGKEIPSIPNLIKPKVSVCFVLGHEVGSLAKVLTILADLGLNLIKIQSIPIHGRPWKYRFFVDFLLAPDTTYTAVSTVLESYVTEFHLLGIYEAGKHIQ